MALLYKILCQRKFLTLITICASGLTAAVTLWWNTQLSDIINMVNIGKPPSKEMILWALVTILAIGVMNYVKVYISGYTCEGMTHDLRMGYARHFTLLSVIETEKLNAGEQLSKLQNEITSVSGYLNTTLFRLLDDSVMFFSAFVWLLFISPALTLAFHLPALIILVYVFWASKIIESATERSQHAKGRMNQYADTLLTLFPIIRLYEATRIIMDGYKDTVKTWQSHTMGAERTKARLLSLSGVLSNIPLLFLLLAGGYMTINGIFTIGTLYIFLNLSGTVSGVMMNMPEYIASFRQFSAGMKRLLPNIILTEKGE